MLAVLLPFTTAIGTPRLNARVESYARPRVPGSSPCLPCRPVVTAELIATPTVGGAGRSHARPPKHGTETIENDRVMPWAPA
jgi:hypothetical protein